MQVIESNIPLLIILLPLLGFLINGAIMPIFYRGFAKTPANVAGGIATFFIASSFILAVKAFLQVHEMGESSGAVLSYAFDWFNYGNLVIPFSLRIDALSSLMTLIITGVGSLIHIYSIGYMHHDHAVGRFFSYLNLFCFAMLLLVLGDSLVILFFGWEGVGLCSYLLIGFWYSDTEKANAGVKAFITNRVGDLGFLVGMFLLYSVFGTLTISEIVALLGNPDFIAKVTPVATLICLALFVGATGKSAQLPLYVWLPDAMAGPTPVSALIHAATMVTAGVYMVARLNPLFELSATALSVVANVGAVTALFAGTIAVAQTDIKKVLAYSTVSQLGYMFLACGVGAYNTAIFHLMTHAFFKALLFLGSGSVIHACSGEQDMRKMGGLKKYLPHTYITMLIGSLAISGIPIFSGFFSKDEIIYSTIALPAGFSHLFIIGVITAILTAFYTARMMSMTFLGEERLSHHAKDHLHESPWSMVGPLYVLAFLAAVGGLLGIPHLLGMNLGHIPHLISHWLSPIIAVKHLPLVGEHLPLHEGVVMFGSIVFAVGSFTIGWRTFKNKFFISDIVKGIAGVQQVLANKYYVDEIYDAVVITSLKGISSWAANVFDKVVIDGAVNGVAVVSRFFADKIRVIQNGDLQAYALVMLFGVFIVVVTVYGILNPL